MNILIIAAHPDDEVLGMGGTIAKHTSKKDNVSIDYLATGITSRNKNNSKKIKENNLKDIKKLQNDAKKSAKSLKVKNVKFYDFPDNKMDGVELLDIVKIVEKEIRTLKPERIYTNHYNDLNVDHRVVFNATITACRPSSTLSVKEILCFEVLSSTEWNFPYNFNANYFVNIKGHIEKKIKAMKFFSGEIRKFPHPRSPENIRHAAGRWGTISGFLEAEAFELIRKFDK